MRYDERIASIQKLTMNAIIEDCQNHVPDKYRLRPYSHPELNHGQDLLKSEEGLDCYISAYGEMHNIKCRGSFQTIDFDKIGNIEIWDWGCGQGLASMTLIDILNERDKIHLLRKITLVEPSQAALERAEVNLKKACPNIQIISINKYLPSQSKALDQIENSNYSFTNIIHLFSNILDIESIDLVKLAHLVSTPGHTHYILCVGPLNYGSYRIDLFASIFNNKNQLVQINSKEYTYTSRNKRITCKANCFIHDGSSLNHSYDKSIKPILYGGCQLKDDYDICGWFKQYAISERAIPFYKRLEECNELNEHDSLFISPDINGEKTDLALVRPGKGVLILKIFEGHPELDKINNLVDVLHSIQGNLIRKYMEDLWGKILANNKYVWSIVKMAILFVDLNSGQIYSWLNELDHQKLKKHKLEFVCNDIPCGFDYVRFVGNDALTNIPGVMQLGWFAPYYNNPDFGELTYQSVMKIFSPSWHTFKEGKGIELDSIQEKLALVPNVTKQINGVAGSGKTQILVQRAVNTHLYTGNPVLILSYNIALANYISYRLNQVKADFGRGEFTILSYHRFFKSNALSLGLKPTKKSPAYSSNMSDNLDADEFEFSYDDINFFNSKETLTKRFDSIFIDEIQDFKPVWIDIIKKYFLKEGGEIVVFGDASQNIYHRPLDKKNQIKVEVARNGWNNSLTKSHRYLNPELTKLIISFHNKFINNTCSHFDTYHVSLFDEFKCLQYYYLNNNTTIDKITEICINILNKKGTTSKDIAIVSNHLTVLRMLDEDLQNRFNITAKTTFATSSEINRINNHTMYPNSDIKNIERDKKIHFTVENQRIKISSIHSFKGWESPILILIIEPTENNSELIYTALTRAREKVVIINCGNQLYHSFFNSYS